MTLIRVLTLVLRVLITLIRVLTLVLRVLITLIRVLALVLGSRYTYSADAAPVVPSWPNVNEVSKSSVRTSACAPTLDRSSQHAAAQLQP